MQPCPKGCLLFMADNAGLCKETEVKAHREKLDLFHARFTRIAFSI